MFDNSSQLLSITEVGNLIHKKPQTIRKWLCQGKLPTDFPKPQLINRRNLWLKKEIESYIENLFHKSC